jgi:hypothetical protein
MKPDLAFPSTLDDDGFDESWHRLEQAQHSLENVELEALNEVPLVALRYQNVAPFETSTAVLSDSVCVRITPRSGSASELSVMATTDLLVVRAPDAPGDEQLVRLPAHVDPSVSVVEFRDGSMTVVFARRFDGPVVVWPNDSTTGETDGLDVRQQPPMRAVTAPLLGSGHRNGSKRKREHPPNPKNAPGPA